ncbi:MAG: hypothetical protein M1831_002582 [Alyxoria varia]|nr:MAG: hypothetical protein M1831_002582 [Alyxoria varia]
MPESLTNPNIFSDDYAMPSTESLINSEVARSGQTGDTPVSPISNADEDLHARSESSQSLASSRQYSHSDDVSASTTRPSSHLPHARTPAHPYALYTQNVAADAAPTSVPTNHIPVGFPGNQSQYHRRIGPEGEEQDLVGPDGHTEQLPPYTRYPDETNQKTLAGTALPAIGESTPVESPESETQGLDRHPLERNSQYGSHGSAGGEHILAPASQYQKEEVDNQAKSWRGGGWNEKKRTKICGVMPLWLVLLLLVGMVVVVAAVCGGVIGGVLGHHAGSEAAQESDAAEASTEAVTTTTETQLLDASAVTSTPAGLPPVPTGTFDSTISEPVMQYSGCLTDKSKRKAWSCSLTSDTLQLFLDTNSQRPKMALSPKTPDLQMGAQPPDISTKSMSLVYDFANQNLGPAFQFQVLFNKTVVLPGSVFHDGDGSNSNDASVRKRKRGSPPKFTGHGEYRPIARSVNHADTPWFCYWPDTFFEAFLYVNESVSSPAPSSTSSMAPAITPPPNMSGVENAQQKGERIDQLFPPSSPKQDSRDLDFDGEDGEGGDDGDADDEDPMDRKMKLFKRNLDDGGSNGFPKKLKLEERRLHTASPGYAYCQKMHWDETRDDWTPHLNDDGDDIWFWLDEEDPTSTDVYTMKRRSTPESKMLRARDAPDSACYCQWNNWA